MKQLNYCWAIIEAMREEMEHDPSVILAGIDVAKNGGAFGASRDLLEQFGPKRVRDTPISENSIVGLGAGAALAGLRAIVEIMYIDFLGLCLDQLCNHAAKMHYVTGGVMKVPLVVRTLVGSQMGTGPQHSQSMEAWVAHVPGLKVLMPSTPYDVKGLLKSAIRDDNPVVFIEHLSLYRDKAELPDEEYTLPIGVADVKRPGRDVTIVATGSMVKTSLAAAESLAGEGVEAEVIDPRTISPLDVDTIVRSVERTNRLLIVTGSLSNFGVAAEISARVQENAFYSLDAPIRRLSPPFTPIPFGRGFDAFLFPNEQAIRDAALQLLS